MFLVDVDVVPSLGLAQGLHQFLLTARCGTTPPSPPRTPRVASSQALVPRLPQCAYVVPTYELDERVRFPRNKSDLVRLAGKGLARPFHHKVRRYVALPAWGIHGRELRAPLTVWPQGKLVRSIVDIMMVLPASN